MTIPKLLSAALHDHLGGRFAVAMARYRQILDMEPNHIDALYLLGTGLLQTGQPGPAVMLIQRAIELAAESGGLTAQHAPLYGNLGNALQASGQVEAAVESYRKGLALAPDLPELHSNLGNTLQELGQLAAAVECYRTALAVKPDYPECLFNLGNALAALQQPAMAIDAYNGALRLRPVYAEASNNLGNVLLSVGRQDEALVALRAGAAADPHSLEIAINLASALSAVRDFDGAIASYRRILADHPEAAAAHYNLGNALLARGDVAAAMESYRRAIAAQPTYGEAHYNLAKLRQQAGDLQAAEDGLRAALAVRPDLWGALFDLGNLLVDQARFVEASAQLQRLVELEPDSAAAHCLFGMALRGEERFDAAVACYRRALALQPEFPAAHYNLAHVLADCGQTEPAIAAFEAAIAQQPNYPEAVRSLGNLLQSAGRHEAAAERFVQALRLQPLITRPASAGPARFSVLMIVAPGRGNTPFDYLTRGTAYDSHLLLFVPGFAYDIGHLRSRADVVFNLVSDVDLGGELLSGVSDLLRDIAKPVINHPDRIRPTDRDSIARTLRDLPDAVVPPTVRYPRAALAAGPSAIALELPILLRPAGRHGGEELDLVTEGDQIAPLVAASSHADYYVTQFVDYSSADGRFRKYRLIFVGDQILPYHLAIADDWKVHYYRTEMVRHDWMRQEEERFLRDPASVLDARHFAALRAIQATVNLDFFGIDCGIDRDGRLVVFEVNASMLVHANDLEPEFAYKQAPVARIKQAFDAMLANAAGRTCVPA